MNGPLFGLAILVLVAIAALAAGLRVGFLLTSTFERLGRWVDRPDDATSEAVPPATATATSETDPVPPSGEPADTPSVPTSGGPSPSVRPTFNVQEATEREEERM